MIDEFASSVHSCGVQTVQYWADEMQLYVSNDNWLLKWLFFLSYYEKQLDMDIVDTAFYGQLQHWLSSKHPNQWEQDVLWGKDASGELVVKSFR